MTLLQSIQFLLTTQQDVITNNYYIFYLKKNKDIGGGFIFNNGKIDFSLNY